MKRLLIGCLLAVLVVGLANANPGDLDTSFGQNGFDIVNIPEQATGRKIAIGAKGEIVVAGTAFPFSQEKFVVLFPPNNALVETSFDAFSVATGMAIQPDGKIVVAGFTAASPSELAPRSLAVARYNPDGSLDATFGNGGKVTTPIGVGGSLLFTPEGVGRRVGGIVIQSNGRIVVSGTVQRPGTGLDFMLVAFTSNGLLDTSFGQIGLFPNLTGTVTTDFGGQEQALGLARQSDDKLIAVGCFQLTANSPSQFAVARYNSNGLLDSTFGGNGRVLTDFVSNDGGCDTDGGNFNVGDTALDVAVQADGKIVVVGRTQTPVLTSPALVRYNTNGSLDSTFGDGGKVTTPFGQAAEGVVIQPDGKIVIADGFFENNVICCEFALIRYTTNGALDTTFGIGGTVATDLRGGFALGVTVQEILTSTEIKGELLVSGATSESFSHCPNCLSVARFDAFTSPLTRTGTFALAPAESIQSIHQPFLYSFTWTVPDPKNWHDLKTLAFRIGDGNNSIITVIFDEATNTFSLLNQATGRPGPSAAPGDERVLETPNAVLYLGNSSVVTAGPISPTVTLNMSLGLKPQTAGQIYPVEVAAADDFGNETGFLRAGTLSVSPR
jgi:uncharacterized delta-60 repeat protein